MKKKLVAAILAFVGVLYLPYILKTEDILAVSNGIVCIPIFIGYYRLVLTMLCRKNKRLYYYTGPLGVIFAFCLSAGRQLSLYRTVDFAAHTTWGAILIYGIMIASLLGWIWKMIFERKWFGGLEESRLIAKWSNSRYAFGINVVILLVCWIPYWIACWPGNWVYDLNAVWDQYSRWGFTTWQPPLHTIFMCSIIDVPYQITGDFNQGIALYTLIQMSLIALIFSYTIQCMGKWKISRTIRLFTLGWLALFPLIPMAAVTSAKDVIFSAAMVWLVDELLLILYSEKITKFHLIRIVISAFLVMAYRNNAVYALIVFLAIILLAKGLRHKKKLMGSITVGLICYFVWSGPIFGLLGVKKEDSREMLSVPLQQIARLYNEVGPIAFSEEDRKLVWEVAPPEIWFKYTAKCSDLVKIDVNAQVIEERTKDCLRVWIKTGLKYPQIYMDAFLENTMDSWYPDTIVDGYKEKHGENAAESSYFAIGVLSPGYGVESKLPWLRTMMQQIASAISYHKIPLVSMFFSIGAVVWLTLIAYFYLWYRKDMRRWILLVPVLYSLTILLGPMVLARYYFHLFFLGPVMIGLILSAGEGNICKRIDANITIE